MTEAGRFCIDWDDFKSTAADRFRDLIGKKEFSDVTLVAADGQRIPSHQVILASGCSFFRSLLENEATPKPLIFLRGVDSNLLQPLITFLYTGGAEVEEELLVDFMALTEDLGVEGLANPNQETEDKKSLAGILGDIPGAVVKGDDGAKDEKQRETKIHNNAKSDILNFYCEKCKRHFNIESNFNRHKLMHDKRNGRGMKDGRGTNNRPGPYKVPIPDLGEDGFYACNSCDKRISDRSNFRRHFQRDHLKIEQNCDECDYNTTDPAKLNIHKKKRHSKPNSILETKPVVDHEFES